MSMTQETRSQRVRQKRGHLYGEAKSADKYLLYQQSVQDTEHDVELATRIFKKRFGRRPHLMREDFCGTAALACCWVEDHKENRAWGIDLDPEPLQWGREHNFEPLPVEQQKRLTLIEGDVRTAETELVEITCAFNFSFFLFKERSELLQYFVKARSTLLPEGMFMLDVYGGADALRTMEETREQDGFDYVWDQHRFDPITHDVTNYIHFEFEDGSKLKRAFGYEWRLWTIPELRDLLYEAGYSDVEVYWEGTDKETGEGDGTYHKATRAADDPAWISYIVAYP